MLSIHLKDLVFNAHHGIYEQEKLLGNKFIVNVHLHYMPAENVINHLDQTVNYETVFAIINNRMRRPSPLLETIVMELCASILESFDKVHAVFVSIEKTNPPILSLQGNVVVSYQLEKGEG
jgi:dihydroneopterin aldolase